MPTEKKRQGVLEPSQGGKPEEHCPLGFTIQRSAVISTKRVAPNVSGRGSVKAMSSGSAIEARNADSTVRSVDCQERQGPLGSKIRPRVERQFCFHFY